MKHDDRTGNGYIITQTSQRVYLDNLLTMLDDLIRESVIFGPKQVDSPFRVGEAGQLCAADFNPD